MTLTAILASAATLWLAYSLVRGLWLPVGAMIAASLSHYRFFADLHLKLDDEMMRRAKESGDEEGEQPGVHLQEGVYVPLLIVTPNKNRS